MSTVVTHTRFFPDILGGIIDAINTDIDVSAVVDNEDGSYDLTVCDIKYLQVGFVVTINDKNYTIDEIDHDNRIVTLIGSEEPPVGIFSAYAPKFYHGTIQQTNSELQKVLDLSNKTPMVYLLESFKERFNMDKMQPHERIVEFRLFFLTQANYSDWETGDYYTEALRPMRNLLDLFIVTARDSSDLERFLEYEATSRTRFGVEITEKGYSLNYFGDHLSGIECSFNLKVRRHEPCICNC